ncbi:hypothetical protein VFPFJ_01041 [Purpureocillium lilacinum]|uniref:Uncharacterized protein n=1 Tax=Purpureocillium lilacinum TaxID=33203 RepID=A0A179HYG5_PURLI|nr:hypothetical protein VFPFJ_01041 [Purpureocillium lilacinum]OAQ94932.1 hypothetical protein VFPFJ_01041 [Purpureocillium lilacinum]
MRQTEGTPTRTRPILHIGRRMDGMMEREGERASRVPVRLVATATARLQGSGPPASHCNTVGRRSRPPAAVPTLGFSL